MTTIAVVADHDKKGCWKILKNYIQRGSMLHDMNLANHYALQLSESEHCDELILAKEEA